MLKHTRNLLLCGIKIESHTQLYMSYLGVNENEAFLKSVSVPVLRYRNRHRAKHVCRGQMQLDLSRYFLQLHQPLFSQSMSQIMMDL